MQRLSISFILLCLTLISFAQFADIRGHVEDTELNYKMPGALIKLYQDDVVVRSVVSGDSGVFLISNLRAGKYTIEVQYSGYNTYKEIFNLSSDQSKYLSIIMKNSDYQFTQIDVIDRTVLDVSKGGGMPLDGDILVNGPYTSATDVVAMDPVVSVINGTPQVGFARREQTGVLENGVKVIGPANPTSLGISQVRALAKGVPAMYGDFTGGLIEITPKSFLDTNQRLTLQINSSQQLEPYNRNAFESLFYTPLIVKDSHAILGVTHSLHVRRSKDGNPSFIPNYRVKDQSLQDVMNQPFGQAQGNNELSNYYFVDADDFEEVSTRQNAGSESIFNSLTFQFNPSEKVSMAIRPTHHYTRNQIYNFSNSLFNSEHNPLQTTNTFRVNAQIAHNLLSPYSSKGKLLYDSGAFSAVNYVIIADYQQFNSTTEDPIYKDDIFKYGHIGKFSTSGVPIYQYNDQAKLITDQYGNEMSILSYQSLAGYEDTLVHFDAQNVDQRNVFTQNVFDNEQVSNYDELQELQGLINGMQPSNIYSLWHAPGTVVSNFSKTQTEKGSIIGILNASWHPNRNFKIKHDLQLGFLYEQQNRSYYSLNATALWRLMPQLLNQQYVKLDTDNPILTYDANGVFTDTVNYNWVIDQDKQSGFDKNLRQIVGNDNGYILQNGHFLDVNSVDPENLSLDMFSANDLWNNGNNYVNYAGYDHKGNRVRKQFGINDFLNDPENRSIGSFNPVYTALWLQDKFVLDKIDIRVGLRVERYDANQYVLKDKYSLFPVRTVAEVNELGGSAVDHPDVVDNDYKVYVDDMNNPTKVVGYRDGNSWYDSDGNELASAEPIRSATSNGVIQPFLVDPSNKQLSEASFEDYDPEILVLPRLSFSFPINTEALFFAYYDKFAQRPNFGQSFSPIHNYYYIQNNSNGILPNPKLKPSERTDYQIGFRQMLGPKSMVTLTSGYAEIRNDINLVNVEQAYPVSYISYDNLDFATVKSFSAEFYTQMKKVYLRTSYMLQFADGTGSNVNAAQALIQANQPNLRSLFPLSYDVRHKLNANMNIDLFELGEVICAPFMKNTSINIFYNLQSGTPYTANLNPTPEAQSLGVASRSQIKGNPFGSRLPWNSNLDLSFVKSFKLSSVPVDLQFNVLNVLNARNIFNVYSYSSLADDDGYLSSPVGEQQLNNQVDAQAFAYLYNLKQNNPAHFGSPRTMSVTIRAHF